MCTSCEVCGAKQIGGVLKQAEKWCEYLNGDICRGGCSCSKGMLRHNITKLQNGQIVTVETCISSETCLEIVNGAKCPYPQVWRDQAPTCVRTCANKNGENQHACPQVWIPRCVCPQDRPIYSAFSQKKWMKFILTKEGIKNLNKMKKKQIFSPFPAIFDLKHIKK